MRDLTLWDLPIHQQAVISSISQSLDSSYALRLNDFGFALGQTIKCERKTPFGGPKIYRVNDTLFSLEKELAQSILISEVQS